MQPASKSNPVEPQLTTTTTTTTTTPVHSPPHPNPPIASASSSDNQQMNKQTIEMLATLASATTTATSTLLAQTLQSSQSSLAPLELLTNLAREKYADILDTALPVTTLDALQSLHEDLETCSSQVLLLERQVGGVEKVVEELDVYSKRLEEAVRRRVVFPYASGAATAAGGGRSN